MQSLIKFDDFIKELNQNNSRNYKMEVLRKYADDEDVKYYLNFLFNPYITTGIGKKSYQRFHNHSCIDVYPNNIFKTTKEALEYLKVHNTSDYETQEYMFSFFMYLMMKEIITKDEKGNLSTPPEEERRYIYELFYKIITKNLPLGIDILTINKCIPNLIPTFNVMLANKYFDKPEVVEGKEFVLTTKIDGSRIIAMKDNGKVSFWTRQGQKYEGLVDLEKELLDSPEDNFVFDGEIVAIDTDLENTYKTTMKLSRTKDLEKHGLKMLVFDYMPIKNFKDQICGLPYQARRGVLTALFGFNSFTYFELLPILYQGTDTAKIIEILNEQTAAGQEGIMINIVEAPYDFKRTNNLLKVKKFQDTELKIIGFEEGTNKLAGTLGAFICEYKGNTVKVGSGLSDEDRAYFWNNKVKFLGRYITVKYFETSTDSKTGLESLRFPVYMRVREDIPTIQVEVNGPRFEY